MPRKARNDEGENKEQDSGSDSDFIGFSSTKSEDLPDLGALCIKVLEGENKEQDSGSDSDFIGFSSTKSEATTDNATSKADIDEANEMAKQLHVHRPGITFVPGARLQVLEARDNKWYNGRVMEVDWGELDVLVHYDRWSQRFDEWLKMDSTRIRPFEQQSSTKSAFKVGEKVLGYWAVDSEYYFGKIIKECSFDFYEVLFYDGYSKNLRGSQLKKIKNLAEYEDFDIDSVAKKALPVYVTPKPVTSPVAEPEIAQRKSSIERPTAAKIIQRRVSSMSVDTPPRPSSPATSVGSSEDTEKPPNKRNIFDVELIGGKRKIKRKPEIEQLFKSMKKRKFDDLDTDLSPKQITQRLSPTLQPPAKTSRHKSPIKMEEVSEKVAFKDEFVPQSMKVEKETYDSSTPSISSRQSSPTPSIARQSSPTLCTSRQSSPTPCTSRQSSPIPSTARQSSPVSSYMKESSPIPSASRQSSPIPSTSPIPSASKQSSPIPSPSKQSSPIPSPSRQSSPIPSASRQSSPIPSASRQSSPIQSASRQSSPTPSATRPSSAAPSTASDAANVEELEKIKVVSKNVIEEDIGHGWVKIYFRKFFSMRRPNGKWGFYFKPERESYRKLRTISQVKIYAKENPDCPFKPSQLNFSCKRSKACMEKYESFIDQESKNSESEDVEKSVETKEANNDNEGSEYDKSEISSVCDAKAGTSSKPDSESESDLGDEQSHNSDQEIASDRESSDAGRKNRKLISSLKLDSMLNSSDAEDDLKNKIATESIKISDFHLTKRQSVSSEQSHACVHETCDKSFRKESLLQMHVKHYHPELFGKEIPTKKLAELPTKHLRSTTLETTASKSQRTRGDFLKEIAAKQLDKGEVTKGELEQSIADFVGLKKDAAKKADDLCAEKSDGESEMADIDSPLADRGDLESEAMSECFDDSIIHCRCKSQEEDGLMLQCDICLTWQHGNCCNIETEQQVPEKYICSICENPKGVRASKRFSHRQDWLREAQLPRFSFSNPPTKSELKVTNFVRRGHELSANVLQLSTLLHSLKIKLNIAKEGNHPKLVMWHNKWDDPVDTTKLKWEDPTEVNKEFHSSNMKDEFKSNKESHSNDVIKAESQVNIVKGDFPSNDGNKVESQVNSIEGDSHLNKDESQSSAMKKLNGDFEEPPTDVVKFSQIIKERSQRDITKESNSSDIIESKSNIENSSGIKFKSPVKDYQDSFLKFLKNGRKIEDDQEKDQSEPIVNNIDLVISENTNPIITENFNSTASENINPVVSSNSVVLSETSVIEKMQDDVISAVSSKMNSKNAEKSQNSDKIREPDSSQIIQSQENESINSSLIQQNGNSQVNKPQNYKDLSLKDIPAGSTDIIVSSSDVSVSATDIVISSTTVTNTISSTDTSVSTTDIAISSTAVPISSTDIAIPTAVLATDISVKSTDVAVVPTDISSESTDIHAEFTNISIDTPISKTQNSIDSVTRELCTQGDDLESEIPSIDDIEPSLPQSQNVQLESPDERMEVELTVGTQDIGVDSQDNRICSQVDKVGPQNVIPIPEASPKLSQESSDNIDDFDLDLGALDLLSLGVAPHELTPSQNGPQLPLAPQIIPSNERIEPVKCKQNLLDHIGKIQSCVFERFDEIEDELKVLEDEMGLSPMSSPEHDESFSESEKVFQSHELIRLLLRDLEMAKRLSDFETESKPELVD